MVWKEHYKVGVQQIDEQHKQLLLRLEELLGTIKRNPENEKEECKQAVEFIKSYVKVHFTTEEMYLESIGFTELEAHKLQHEQFAVQIRDLEYELIRQDYNPETVERFANRLIKWWIQHIMREDKKMADPQYRSNG